jgi:hypothetical protein
MPKNKSYKRDLELIIVFIAVIVGIIGHLAYTKHQTIYHQALIIFSN